MNYFRKSGRDGHANPDPVQGRGNPFANKRNTLTPNQMRKRKRLIKHIKKSK
nr:GTP-binding protein EngA [Klebsiella pneumoniae]